MSPNPHQCIYQLSKVHQPEIIGTFSGYSPHLKLMIMVQAIISISTVIRYKLERLAMAIKAATY